MRTKDELNSKEFNDNMDDLIILLNKHKIKYTKTRHGGSQEKVKELLGYYPGGEWHIHIGKISIIRGLVSFGSYEAYGDMYKEPERFETGKELLEDYIKRYKL